MQRMRWRALVACAFVWACGGDASRDDAAAADSLAALERAAETARLLTPLHSVSGVITEFGAVAATRAERADVRRYAEVIVADHRAVTSALDSVVRARGLALDDTTVARDLENAVSTAHAGLDALGGADFDLAYVRAEVESHRLLIDRLDQELIPGMQDADLRGLLQQVRAMTDAHLARARQLLAELLDRPTSVPRATTPRPDTVMRPPLPPDTGAVRVS